MTQSKNFEAPPYPTESIDIRNLLKMKIWGEGRGGMRYFQQEGLKSGQALERHISVSHNGTFDPECPACQEIKRKTLDSQK